MVPSMGNGYSVTTNANISGAINPSNAVGYFHPKEKDTKIFENHFNPVMFFG